MKNKSTCIIVEDLSVAAEFLKRFCDQSGLLEVRGVFPEAQSALDFLDTNPVDLIFLDVEMPGLNGFEFLERLPKAPRVIITTSKPEYAYNAYENGVDDFLKKPFSYKRFMEAVEKLAGEQEGPVSGKGGSDHIFIKVDQKLVKLKHEEILFIESMGDYVRFVTGSKKYTTLSTMKHVESFLNTGEFLKVHRSYIVNVGHIDDLQGNMIFIQKQEVPIGKGHREQVLQRLNIL